MKLSVMPVMKQGGTALAVCALVAALSSCGGGTAGSSSSSPAPSALSGTVAVGSPMLDATITVKDANGNVRTATAASDGSYSGISTEGLTPPFSIEACGLVDSKFTCLYSVAHSAGVANVTPLTHGVLALALGEDPSALFDAAAAAPGADVVAAQAAKLKAALSDMLTKAGVAGADFFTTAFTANRTGMDKVLDAIKVSTETDGASGKTFVQVEGKIGSGSAYLDKDSASGSVVADSGIDTDLRGISRIFVDGLSHAISASDLSTCLSRLTAADVFDSAFSMDIGAGPVTKATAPQMFCGFAQVNNLLGGKVIDPVLRDCDFTTDPNKKVCEVGFSLAKGSLSFDGAELAVVLRNGSDWKLLGRDSPYEIHIGSAVQRTMRIDLPGVDPKETAQYSRALTFDIAGSDGISDTGIRAAKVYQRNLTNTGWEATPVVTLTLTDACIAATPSDEKPRLGIVGSNCGASWLSLGDTADTAATGDALIDNFYRRGRKVRVDLYDNVAALGTPVSVVKRIDGVPPKFAALASFPWLELEASSRAGLVAYDGASASFPLAWARNPVVAAKDVTFCLDANCTGAFRAAHEEIEIGEKSMNLQLSTTPAGASAYKQISLYGRTREDVGVSSNYVSCGGAVSCN